uniref:N/A n=1 Tax=Ganoderma boninense TaxID=34458 RepID=A0A5K1JY35_9APHY|nr:N/A [Ganoderma boninense]
MVLRTMLLTHESGVSSRIDPQEQRRLQDEIPTLRNALRSITNKSSAWQEELGASLEIFAILEGPADAVELLLSSLSSSLPNTYLAHGKILVQRLARLWSERRVIVERAVGLAPGSPGLQLVVGRLSDQREEQVSIIRSFMLLITQINEVPPLYFLNQEFTAHQFSGANWVFSRLEGYRASIVEDIEHLENSLDHFLDVLGTSED